MVRVVAAGIPHHVTQRGNGGRFFLSSDADRLVYLGLLRESLELHGVSLVGYCLMSNHVHLIMIPRAVSGLASALKQTHGQYAAYWNAAHGSSGHVWQGRYYSCPLDEAHFWEALRYTEMNPVRSGLVAEAVFWPWSSAAAHCGFKAEDDLLDMEPWRVSWDPVSWRTFLGTQATEAEITAIRECTHTGRPLGTEEFVGVIEGALGRCLTPQKGGRPRNSIGDTNQGELIFDSTK